MSQKTIDNIRRMLRFWRTYSLLHTIKNTIMFKIKTLCFSELHIKMCQVFFKSEIFLIPSFASVNNWNVFGRRDIQDGNHIWRPWVTIFEYYIWISFCFTNLFSWVVILLYLKIIKNKTVWRKNIYI